MYLALDAYGKLSSAGPACGQQRVAGIRKDVPLGRIALLLDLGEDAVGFVIDAVRASRKLAVALDLLLSAHVAGLATNGTQLAIAIPPTHRRTRPSGERLERTHSCNSPPLGLVRIVEERAGVAKHLRRQLRRQLVELHPRVWIATKYLGRLIHQWGSPHRRHLEAAVHMIHYSAVLLFARICLLQVDIDRVRVVVGCRL